MKVCRKLQDLMFPCRMWVGALVIIMGIAAVPAPVCALDLNGTYIRLGINSDGSLVNDTQTLGAKFPDSPAIEFFVPGTPYEGWSVGANGSLYRANFAPARSPQIPVTVTNTSAGSIKSALVTGTATFGTGQSLAIKRTIAFDVSDTAVRFEIELTNTGTVSLTNVAFMEGGDPDQGTSLGGGSYTYNDIVLDGKFVRAWASASAFPLGLTVGLGTKEPSAVLSVESSWSENPYDILNSPVDPGDSMDDAEICLAFNFGALGVGQTVSAEYYMVFGRSVSEADTTFGHLAPPSPLTVSAVTPPEDFDSSGNEGGPFTPATKDYLLTNIGPNTLAWTAIATQSWLDISPAGGTLNPGDFIQVQVSLNSNASSLEPGSYEDIITFAHNSTGASPTRSVSLQVNRIPGEIEITDSIEPVDDMNMPFGAVIIGLPRTEQVTITNTDPLHSLLVDLAPPFEGFFDEFPTTTLDSEKWTNVLGGPTIDTDGIGEPSGPYSLRLNGDPSGGDAVVSRVIDLSGQTGVQLRYWYERTGGGEDTDPGEDLFIEYWNGSTWVELERQLGSGSNMTSFVESVITLPPAAFHTNFRLRFRNIASACACDDWFVDNVSLALADATTLNEGSSMGTGFRLDNVPPLPVEIGPSGSITLDVIFEPTAEKAYSGRLMIYSDDSDEAETPIELSGTGINDYLEITPDANLAFAGHPGGPFVPSNIIYTLTNNGPASIDWTAEPNASWVTVSPPSGTLGPGASTTLTAFPNAIADGMAKGQYAGGIRLTDVTTTKVHYRGILLDVYTDPKIRVQPSSIAVSIPQGESETATITIENTGDGDLDFSLSSRQTGFTPPLPPSSALASAAGNNDISPGMPANHDFNVPADVPFAEDRILVCFKPKADGKPRDQKDKQQVLDSFGGGQVKHNFKLHPGLSVVNLPQGLTVREALKTFNSKKTEILYAEPDYQLTLFSNFPNDTYFTNLWGMHNTGQTGGTNDADIDAPEAWDISTNGSNIIVAVIDTGVDYTHPDLAANMWVNTAEKNGIPGVDDDGNGYIDDIYGYDFYNRDGNPMDDHGHGTHCSGTIGAVGNNGQGVAGVCWNAKIMAVKFLNSGGGGYDSDAIDSIEYAVQMGAKVASNSWGGGGYSQALKDAIDAAGSAGMLFVAAAGNDYGNNNDIYPHYPSSYDCANIIAVLSTDYYDAISSFSSYGPTSVDLGAPGSNIYSCRPGNQYTYMSGTSMATPHVSGACALVWSVCPYLSSSAIKDIILQTTDPLPSLDGRCVSDGRLNLSNAIAEAGTAWVTLDPPKGTVGGDTSSNVLLTFNAERPAGVYTGEIIVSSNDPFYPQVSIPVAMTVEPVDYLTELFDANDPNQNDLAYRKLVFSPQGRNSYSLCIRDVNELPVDPMGGTVISLDDDDYAAIPLAEGKIPFFGKLYDAFYIGSNGYISFLSGDLRLVENLEDHYDLPRISAIFDDLDPSSGGQISYKQLRDGIVVTFEDVPEYGSAAGNTFQVEMLFGGKIIVTFLNVAAEDGLAGLSDGRGLPGYFTMCDLSAYGACNFVADVTGDEVVDFCDFAVFTQCEQRQYEDMVTETVRDQFDVASYGNNDGTLDWIGLWQESGEADGPAAGLVQVAVRHGGGQLSFNPPSKGAETACGLVRDANLAGAITSTLTFDYETENKTGQLTAQISPDGGATWQTLAVYNSTSGNGSASFDISPYAEASILIRFELASGSIMCAYIDNVQIEYDIIPWTSPCDECNLDRNQIIDLSDLAIFAEHWLD